MEYVLFGIGYLIFGIFYTIAVMRWFPDNSWVPTTPIHPKDVKTFDISLSILLWILAASAVLLEIFFAQIGKFICTIVTGSKHKVKKPDGD